jgi:Xaa-Pro aminopeptidase
LPAGRRSRPADKGSSGTTMLITPRFHPVGLDRVALAATMQRAGIETLLLTSPENVFYTTGYTSLPSAGNPILYTLRNRLPHFAVVNATGETTLLCWGFSAENVDFGADRIIGFNNFSGALDRLSDVIAETSPAGTIGVESTCPRYVLGLLSGRDLVDADHPLATLRLIKSATETDLLRRSTAIIEQTVAELYPLLRRGMLRSELMREARYRLLRNGASGISHLTFSFGRSNPEVEADEPLEPGSLVTLDLGGIVDGYCSDNRRYAYVGEVPTELEAHYRLMVEIVDAVGAALVPGAVYSDLYRLALELYASHGIEPLERFSHVGHNIGLETEEEWLDDDGSRTVEAGMVINIELYSKAPTGDMIGDEETYVIGPDGPERISVLPREIHVVDG